MELPKALINRNEFLVLKGSKSIKLITFDDTTRQETPDMENFMGNVFNVTTQSHTFFN